MSDSTIAASRRGSVRPRASFPPTLGRSGSPITHRARRFCWPRMSASRRASCSGSLPLDLRSARKSALGKSGAVRRAGPRSAAGSRGRRRRSSADARRRGGRCRARRGRAQVDVSTARPGARGGGAAPTARGGSAGCDCPDRPRRSPLRSTGGDSRVVVGRRTPKAYRDGVRVEGCGGLWAGGAMSVCGSRVRVAPRSASGPAFHQSTPGRWSAGQRPRSLATWVLRCRYDSKALPKSMSAWPPRRNNRHGSSSTGVRDRSATVFVVVEVLDGSSRPEHIFCQRRDPQPYQVAFKARRHRRDRTRSPRGQASGRASPRHRRSRCAFGRLRGHVVRVHEG